MDVKEIERSSIVDSALHILLPSFFEKEAASWLEIILNVFVTMVTLVHHAIVACLGSVVMTVRVVCRGTLAGMTHAVCHVLMGWLQNPAGMFVNALRMMSKAFGRDKYVMNVWKGLPFHSAWNVPLVSRFLTIIERWLSLLACEHICVIIFIYT